MCRPRHLHPCSSPMATSELHREEMRDRPASQETKLSGESCEAVPAETGQDTLVGGHAHRPGVWKGLPAGLQTSGQSGTEKGSGGFLPGLYLVIWTGHCPLTRPHCSWGLRRDHGPTKVIL